MLQRGIPAFILLFFFSLAAMAQSPADSVGTIRVVKKPEGKPVTAVSESAVYTVVEEMPSFPKSEMTMKEFIDATFVVPQQAIDRGLSGTIFISFMVDADGELKDIKVARGLPNCPDCNAEAVRVVNQMPLWIPGRQNGKAVPVMMSIPIKFRFNQ